MLYQRSFEIEHRLERVLQLIMTGQYSTLGLAEVLRVSMPTVSRDVTALRERGHDIRAEKLSDGWRYILFRNGFDQAESEKVSAEKIKAG